MKRIKRIKLVLTVLVVLVGFSLLYIAYLIWPQTEVNVVSIFSSVIVGGVGLFFFTFTTLINKGKDEWINIVLPGI